MILFAKEASIYKEAQSTAVKLLLKEPPNDTSNSSSSDTSNSSSSSDRKPPVIDNCEPDCWYTYNDLDILHFQNAAIWFAILANGGKSVMVQYYSIYKNVTFVMPRILRMRLRRGCTIRLTRHIIAPIAERLSLCGLCFSER